MTQVQQVQTTQGGQQQQTQAPTRLVLGQLPSGKLVLQGSQLAALTQARTAGQAGGQPKVVTIQLQVQQQPNQQGGVKVRNKLLRSASQLQITHNKSLNSHSVTFSHLHLSLHIFLGKPSVIFWYQKFKSILSISRCKTGLIGAAGDRPPKV